MTPNEMLQLLSRLWVACLDYPEADHYRILKHIEELQKLVFRLEKEGRG